jgi:hypothetical protein
MKAGDIVIWAPIPGKVGKEWRIVDVLSTQEPKQLLLTDLEGDGSKCNPALTCDCTLVREGEPPKRVIIDRSVPMRDSRPHILAEDR